MVLSRNRSASEIFARYSIQLSVSASDHATHNLDSVITLSNDLKSYRLTIALFSATWTSNYTVQVSDSVLLT